MHRWPLRVLTIAAAALLAACSHADRSTAQGSAADTNGGSASAGSWAHSDTALSRLRVHSGFSIHLFASGLHDPRMMAFGPDSALYVSEPTKGTVMRLVDVDGDGHADSTMTAVSGLNRPHGVAWHGDTLWIGNTDAVVIAWSTKHDGTLDGLHTVVDGLPSGGRHWTKTIHFPPPGAGQDGYFFLSMGSSCNVCEEHDPLRATISRWTLDGKPAGATTLMNPTVARKLAHNGGRYASAIWAYGLRNSVDFGWEPQSGAIWATHNGGDMLGGDTQAVTDTTPPEEIVNIIQKGGYYGWPYCYDRGLVNPIQHGGTPALCKQQIAPALTDSAHSAPLGMAFYTGTQFPPLYRGNEFIAEHGSWNRSKPVGYRVIRVIVSNGKPMGFEPFITGWRTAGGKPWGRPAGIAVGPKGTLYISDDMGGRIYAVRWAGEAK